MSFKMKTVIFFLILFAFLNGYACEESSSLSFTTDKETIFLNQVWPDNEVNLFKFDYLPLFEKRIYQYPNGSFVGYLPIEDPNLKIRAWSDLRNEFILFFCNSSSGEFNKLSQGIGWSFRILDAKEAHYRWISILSNNKIAFLKLDQHGVVGNEIDFPITINVDLVEIDEIDENVAEVTLANIESEVRYRINWDTKSVVQQTETQRTSH